MWRKITTCFVLLTFMNLTIAFDLAFADSSQFGTIEAYDKNAVLTATLITLGVLTIIGVIILIAVKSKKSDSSSEEPKEQKRRVKIYPIPTMNCLLLREI